MLPEPPASCSSASPRLVFYGPLDDEVALVAFDDLVDPVELMAGPDEEPPWVSPNGLVLLSAQLDKLAATVLETLAKKRLYALVACAMDALVDLTVGVGLRRCLVSKLVHSGFFLPRYLVSLPRGSRRR